MKDSPSEKAEANTSDGILRAWVKPKNRKKKTVSNRPENPLGKIGLCNRAASCCFLDAMIRCVSTASLLSTRTSSSNSTSISLAAFTNQSLWRFACAQLYCNAWEWKKSQSGSAQCATGAVAFAALWPTHKKQQFAEEWSAEMRNLKGRMIFGHIVLMTFLNWKQN